MRGNCLMGVDVWGRGKEEMRGLESVCIGLRLNRTLRRLDMRDNRGVRHAEMVRMEGKGRRVLVDDVGM